MLGCVGPNLVQDKVKLGQVRLNWIQVKVMSDWVVLV